MNKEDKKIAIVTGGTRGIGLDISKDLIANGYFVVAIYAGNEAAAKAFKADTGCDAYKVDVSDLDACLAVAEKIKKKHGVVSVLVNNAGITRDGMLHKMTGDQWMDVITTNLSSCFNMCRAVIADMRAAGFGRVINISSINGQKGQLGQTNYAAAKAGMIGFTKSLALESARKGITANVICPGYIKTEMTEAMDAAVLESIVKQIPQGRMGQPSEIASIVSFLASDNAAYITGATISANGGQYMA